MFPIDGRPRRVAPTKTEQNKACSDAVRALSYDVRDVRHIFVIRECPVVRRRGDPVWSPESMFPQKQSFCGKEEAPADKVKHFRTGNASKKAGCRRHVVARKRDVSSSASVTLDPVRKAEP